MNTRTRHLLGLLASLLLAPACWAQVPAVPVAPAAPANLWSFLLPNAEQKAACKNCFCNSPLGQLTSGAAGPMTAMSGGLITNRCAKNAIDNDIAKKPADSSEGAAARIKKDEADAKARREAVRFLGTVDCNYWPEATDSLILSLRKDPNECVRFEAALALGNGCCCNEKTIKALEMSITMSDKDGAPPERSDRVRAAAADALARCPMLQKEIELKEKNGDIKKTEGVDPGEFYRRASQASREQVIASARGVLVSLQQANKALPSGTASTVAPIHQRSGSLSGMFANAFTPTSPVLAPVPAPVMAPTQTKPQSLFELVTARNTKQEFIVPAAPTVTNYAPPAPLPATVPQSARPIMQGGLGTPLSVQVTTFEQPRSSLGSITVETVPLDPSAVRPARP